MGFDLSHSAEAEACYKILQNSKFQIYYIEKEFSMHEVLNLDEIKNKLHSLLVNCETNLMSLIRL
jgi:hypothetical protein